MIKSPQIERELNFDPERIFCVLCKNADISFFDVPCKDCKLIITNFEVEGLK